MRRRLPPWARDALILGIWLALFGGCLALVQGCGATPRRVASVSVVSLGTALASVHAEHRRVFDRASDELAARLHADGGVPADYDREAAPLVAAFRARGEAIYALDSALYAAAAVIDMSRTELSPAWLPAAARLSDALDRILRVLADGAILPAVAIPAAVTQVTGALRAITAPLLPAPSARADGGRE